MTWRTVFSFILLATLLTLLMGWLISMGVLPIQQVLHFSPAQLTFTKVWLRLAVAITLILPIVAWFAWFRQPQPRRILDFYLSVLIIQILSEHVFSRVLFQSVVVIIGTLYTAFRIWQLWRGQQLIRQDSGNFPKRKQINALLSVLLVFWCCNLIVILATGWPRILSG